MKNMNVPYIFGRREIGKIKRDREITQDLMRNEERENEMKFFYQLCL